MLFRSHSACGLHGANVYLKLGGKHGGGCSYSKDQDISHHRWVRRIPSGVIQKLMDITGQKRVGQGVLPFPGNIPKGEEGNKECSRWLISALDAGLLSSQFLVLPIIRPPQSSPAYCITI